MSPYYPQRPNETRDVAFDWSDRLDDVGSPQDTIDTSTWAISDIGSPTPTITPQATVGIITSALVSGLEAGQVIVIRNVITTAMGRQHEKEVTLRGMYP